MKGRKFQLYAGRDKDDLFSLALFLSLNGILQREKKKINPAGLYALGL